MMGTVIERIHGQTGHESPIESGRGFAVYDVKLHGGEHEVILYNHNILARDVEEEIAHAKTHHHMLTDKPIWEATEAVRLHDHALFRMMHDCSLLRHLLGHAHLEGPPVGTQGEAPPASPQGPQQAIPEPSSIILMIAALAWARLFPTLKRCGR